MAKDRTKGATSMDGNDLGEALVSGAFITEAELKSALEIGVRSGRKLTDVLLEQGLVDPDVLTSVLSLQHGVPVVNLSNVEVQPQAIALVPENVARERQALAISLEEDTLTVATDDPQDFDLANTLTNMTRKKVELVLAVGMRISDAIDSNYRLTSKIEEQISQIAEAGIGKGQKDVQVVDAGKSGPIIQAVEMMLTQAVRDRASDIHIEPQEDCVLVRNRIDGVLHEAVRLPLGAHSAVMTRIKVLSNLNIAERRRPQDGQFGIKVGDRQVDFRVATIESDYGEMAVLRVLDKSMLLINLEDLGMNQAVLQPFERLLRAPFGMIMVNGPTGSGKTTTLYSALQQLDAKATNIMTIEDPIEYRFKGINQIQVNRQAGITFAVGLRTIMRLDPDIILVGEIRDQETATTAVQAAITGHLVLSSIHANDSVSALLRLIDMGVEPFLVTSAVIGSLSQRLVRKVCTYCRHEIEVSPSDAAAYERVMNEKKAKFAAGRGCNFCSRSGFMGRLGAFELLTVSDELRKMVMRGVTASELKEQAVNEGLVAMPQDGMQKVKDGLTTPGEVVRSVFTIV
jgi:general secretion pathway protein E